MKCSKCGNEFDGKFCPECGTPAEQDAFSSPESQSPYAQKANPDLQPPTATKKKNGGCLKIGLIVVLALLALVVLVSVFGENDSPSSSSQSQLQIHDTSKASDVLNDNSKDSATIGQRNALGSAKQYLATMAFSYDGLIGQLEYEGYTHDEAVYGVDNCGADWSEQALASAKSYLNTSAFSYSGLIGQLEFEQFTTEQATYAADNCGADWNEQAAKSAKSYLNVSTFSRQSLIDQLEFEGFTTEQATYGAEANGY